MLAKRLLDIILSAVMLLFLSPLMLLVAVGILVDDGGPVLYRQLRWGKGGRKFVLYKFRSMKAAPPEEPIIGAAVGDPRVTRLGGLLRATGMDELPQLLNILRGDMSFVGPRALAVDERIVYGGLATSYEDVPGFTDRLAVPPGLTGVATIFLAKSATPQEKLDYDLWYVEKRTLRLDLKLIWLSFWISFRGKWESRDPKTGSAPHGPNSPSSREDT